MTQIVQTSIGYFEAALDAPRSLTNKSPYDYREQIHRDVKEINHACKVEYILREWRRDTPQEGKIKALIAAVMPPLGGVDFQVFPTEPQDFISTEEETFLQENIAPLLQAHAKAHLEIWRGEAFKLFFENARHHMEWVLNDIQQGLETLTHYEQLYTLIELPRTAGATSKLKCKLRGKLKKAVSLNMRDCYQ